jgi:hypothetical protein
MRRPFTTLLATVAFGWLMAAGPVLAATIHPTDETPVGATAIANAVKTPSFNMTGALFQTAPPNNDPNGWADSPINVFPTNGPSFGILTSGQVTLADDPNTAPNSGQADGGVLQGRGPTAYDVSVLAMQFTAPASANCLTFDFKFFSEEYPEYVGTQYNDAFIAELDATTWTTTGPPTNDIISPNNFAFDGAPGNQVTVNTAGFSAGNAAGTTYDGATVLLSASTTVTPGPHTLYLSILDQGDQIYDSAVFLDNLRVGFVSNPAVNCAPGAQPVNFQMTLEPAEATNRIGTPHTVTATLTDESGTPVPGATIQFNVTGANTAAGVNATDASGEATFTYAGTNIGDDTITACYNADASPDGSCEAEASAIKHWTVGPPATLTLSPKSATNTVGDTHCVTATVKDVGGNPVPNVLVVFNVPTAPATGADPSAGAQTTNGSGQAQFCWTASLPGEDTVLAAVDSNGNGQFDLTDHPSDSATKTWTLPASTEFCEVKVTEGGWIIARNDDRANFGGNAKVLKGGDLQGQEEYQDQGPAQEMNLHSIRILAMTCTADLKHATIWGEATIDGSPGIPPWIFRIDVADLSQGGSDDSYGIIVSNGYASGQKQLEGGNVTIHKN